MGLDFNEIIERFRKKYNKYPESWKVFYFFENSKLFVTIYNTKKRKGWIVYLEPHRTFGMEIKKVQEIEKLENLADFGYRVLPEKLSKRVIKEIYEYEAVTQKTVSEILNIEVTEEKVIEEEKVENFALGPGHFFNNGITYIDRKIVEKLMKKAEEKWRKENFYIF